jgi:FdhD protein
MTTVAEIDVNRYSHGTTTFEKDTLAVEEPLGIHLKYGPVNAQTTQSVSVTMRTPGADKELSVGFLFTEGIIDNASQVAEVTEGTFGENTVLVRLTEDAKPVLRNAERNFYTTSSCGVCGKSSIDAIHVTSPFAAHQDNIVTSSDVLLRLPSLLREQQETFNSTGGLHASALFTVEGKFISLKEDVGRHNALDKVIGEAFLQNSLPLSVTILLLSGRASFELVQKAVMAGIRLIAAIGAPSSLAVELAQEHDVTLVGFLRDERFNVYTHGRRIRTEA